MKGVVTVLAVGVFLAYILFLLLCLLKGIKFLILATTERDENYHRKKEDVIGLRMNPLNILLYPDCLTETGKNYRKNGFKFVAVFCIGAAIPALGEQFLRWII